MFEPWDGAPFKGAKAALVHMDTLVVLRRDAHEGLPWPGHLDLPGGGRDGDESPVDCVRRESVEEVSLILPNQRFHFAQSHPRPNGQRSWFLAAEITEQESHSLVLGDEGQACWMMPIADFLSAEDAVPYLQDWLRAYQLQR